MPDQNTGYMPDQVSIQMPGGYYNLLTIREWLAMSVNERIELISSGKAQFLQVGQPISTLKALKELYGHS